MRFLHNSKIWKAKLPSGQLILSIINIDFGIEDTELDQEKNILYVSNSISNTISSYNLSTNKQQYGAKFNSVPPIAGKIICSDTNGSYKDVTNKYIKYDMDSTITCKWNVLQTCTRNFANRR